MDCLGKDLRLADGISLYIDLMIGARTTGVSIKLRSRMEQTVARPCEPLVESAVEIIRRPYELSR